MLQERLATRKYGADEARFPHLNALNGVQSATCFVWAVTLLLIFKPAYGPDLAPVTAYWLPGLTNSVGPACGYQALKNISYPAQVSASLKLPVTHPNEHTSLVKLSCGCLSLASPVLRALALHNAFEALRLLLV